MSKPYSLPPGCILRPTRSTDKLNILLILFLSSPKPILSVFALFVGIGMLIDMLIQAAIVGGVIGLTYMYIFLLTIMLLLILYIKFRYNDSRSTKSYVVEWRGRLLAYVVLFDYVHFSLLQLLFVAPNRRKQGIGSYIVHNFITQANKPIFLLAAFGTKEFYTRLGFVEIQRQQLPQPIKKWARANYPVLVYDSIQK